MHGTCGEDGRRAPNSKGVQQLEQQLHLLDMAATNRVKGAPSTMAAGRAEIGEEAFEHKAAAEECGINKSRMKTKAIIPAVLTRALTVVYLGEKQINLSPFPSSLLQHFEFDVKVKKEKVGRRKIEGWTKKSLSIPWCRQENRPIRRPGEKMVACRGV